MPSTPNARAQGHEYTGVRWSPLSDLDISRLNTPQKCQMLPLASHANCRCERHKARTFRGCRYRKPLTTGSHHRSTVGDTGVLVYCAAALGVLLGIPHTAADRNLLQEEKPTEGAISREVSIAQLVRFAVHRNIRSSVVRSNAKGNQVGRPTKLPFAPSRIVNDGDGLKKPKASQLRFTDLLSDDFECLVAAHDSTNVVRVRSGQLFFLSNVVHKSANRFKIA